MKQAVIMQAKAQTEAETGTNVTAATPADRQWRPEHLHLAMNS
ncbi:hypothetical protein [Croceibacterium mercuriale]|nr:hypothetical protein [Croceibacterium mercuriale]